MFETSTSDRSLQPARTSPLKGNPIRPHIDLSIKIFFCSKKPRQLLAMCTRFGFTRTIRADPNARLNCCGPARSYEAEFRLGATNHMLYAASSSKVEYRTQSGMPCDTRMFIPFTAMYCWTRNSLVAGFSTLSRSTKVIFKSATPISGDSAH